jgi:ribosomal protein L28
MTGTTREYPERPESGNKKSRASGKSKPRQPENLDSRKEPNDRCVNKLISGNPIRSVNKKTLKILLIFLSVRIAFHIGLHVFISTI